MKAFQLIAVIALSVATGTDAFATTKKRELDRRHAFQTAPVTEPSKDDVAATTGSSSSNTPVPATGPVVSPTAMFALPPSAMSYALSLEDEDEEIDVNYGVALVSCILSLALGFGIGYGV
jgi:hypothetical protein